MLVPASIPASAERAKSEWDAVLLRQTRTDAATPVWDVCLLLEAKASIDAATADLPRLQRGLRLLAHADDNAVYPFQTRQGVMHLRGASLRALPADPSDLANMRGQQDAIALCAGQRGLRVPVGGQAAARSRRAGIGLGAIAGVAPMGARASPVSDAASGPRLDGACG
ncbi:hypothetical protein G6F65_015994 [Rhizopus arrhizus]|nr:hypothetical protein G6F65_015994 [Rhizopus arrhizus]